MNWRGLKTACAAVVLSVMCTPVLSQNYYLVIGAFSTENDDVKEFTSYLPSNQFDTAYSIQSNNNSLHLYIMKTSSKEVALAKGEKLQEELAKVNGASVLPSNQRLDMETKATTSEPEYEVLASTGSNKTSDAVPSGGGVPMKPKGK